MPDVIAICGSLRSESLNRKLLKLAIRELTSAGLTVEALDLKTAVLPLYDGDLEEASGLPPLVVEHQAKVRAAPGLLVVTPEYNGSIPGGLKNWVDWLSRGTGNCFAGRVISINTASAGAFGGVRCTIALKTSLTHLDGWVVPGAMNLPKAGSAFDERGELKESWMKSGLSKAMTTFAEGVRRFR